MVTITASVEAKDAQVAAHVYAAMKAAAARYGVTTMGAVFDPPLGARDKTALGRAMAEAAQHDPKLDRQPGESEEDHSYRMDRVREARQNAEKDRSLATAEPPTAKFGRVFGQ